MPEDLKEDTRTLAALVPATKEKAGSRKLYDRFITVVTILNQIDKFNTNIELVAENSEGRFRRDQRDDDVHRRQSRVLRDRRRRAQRLQRALARRLQVDSFGQGRRGHSPGDRDP